MNKNEFINALKELNIKITPLQLEKLETYYNLLIEENKKYNLTAITKKEDVYLKHFYDSLTLNKIINLSNQYLCDIGTGAGFPGIVLKIIFPNLKITLLDSTEKKCKFLKLVISELNLNNIDIINERAEIYSKTTREKYDIVTSRAVAPLKHLLEYSISLVKVNGYYIAMKGDISKDIIGIDTYETKLGIKEESRLSFKLPKENSLRTLIKYKKMTKTSTKYPRKYTEIKKNKII